VARGASDVIARVFPQSRRASGQKSSKKRGAEFCGRSVPRGATIGAEKSSSRCSTLALTWAYWAGRGGIIYNKEGRPRLFGEMRHIWQSQKRVAPTAAWFHPVCMAMQSIGPAQDYLLMYKLERSVRHLSYENPQPACFIPVGC